VGSPELEDCEMMPVEANIASRHINLFRLGEESSFCRYLPDLKVVVPPV
jgi:hypothetical protein